MAGPIANGMVGVMNDLREQGGFTLVELMVVVLIIGILVAVAIPVFNGATDNARVKTCYSNQRTIEGAVQVYRAGGLNVGPGLLNGNGTATTADVLIPTYLKEAPRCPTSKAFYFLDANGSVVGDRASAAWIAGHDHYQ